LRTRIYIDGYNLYYGCLKNSPAYKWLDLVRLFEDYILPRSVNPHSKLHSFCGIKFYTADISSNVAQDPNSQKDQQSYHSALKNRYANQSKIDIVKGNYAIGKIDSKKVEYSPDGKTKPPKDCASVKVWKFEEKQSDANIAVDALFDAFTDTTCSKKPTIQPISWFASPKSARTQTLYCLRENIQELS